MPCGSYWFPLGPLNFSLSDWQPEASEGLIGNLSLSLLHDIDVLWKDQSVYEVEFPNEAKIG